MVEMNSSSSDENSKELQSINSRIEILEKELVDLKRKKSYIEEIKNQTTEASQSIQQPYFVAHNSLENSLFLQYCVRILA